MDKTLSGEFNLSTPEKIVPSITNPPSQSKDKIHFSSSFAYCPEGVNFEEQKENEKIELFLRRHFITNFPWILASLALSLLPILFPFISKTLPFPLPSPTIIILILFTYYVFIFGFLLLNFTLWYFQTGIVTNIRVIDVDITGILFREVSEAKDEDIQDVTYTQIGLIRSLFNYGNVLVQTSGSLQNIEFDRVPRPATVARIIGDLTHLTK